MKKYYYIQSIETSLCLCEEFDTYFGPKWSKKGKRWENLDDVKNHLRLLKEKRIPVSPFWEIVVNEKGEKDRFPAVGLLT
jgi:hypothetical protein